MHFKKQKNIPENACPKKCPILHAELWTSYITDIESRDSISVRECVHEDIFLKAWNHKAKDLIWNVICFFFLLFVMHDVLFTTAQYTFVIFFHMSFSFFFLGKQIFRSLNSLFRNNQCISKTFLWYIYFTYFQQAVYFWFHI
jgi:hypothetical protein